MSDSKRENPFQRSMLIIEVPELEFGSEVSEEILRNGDAACSADNAVSDDGEPAIQLVEIIEEPHSFVQQLVEGAGHSSEEEVLSLAQATAEASQSSQEELAAEVNEESPESSNEDFQTEAAPEQDEREGVSSDASVESVEGVDGDEFQEEGSADIASEELIEASSEVETTLEEGVLENTTTDVFDEHESEACYTEGH